ncbi:hypothetical protein LCFBJUUZ_CDS0139 [Staphylococcus phage PG-2021_76]
MEKQFFEDLMELIKNKSKEYGHGTRKIKVKNKGITYRLHYSRRASKVGYYVDIRRVNQPYDITVFIVAETLDKFPNFKTLEQVFDYERELYDTKEKEELERSKRLDSMLENVTIVE